HEGNSGISSAAVAAPVEARVPKLAPLPPDTNARTIRHGLFLRWVLFQSVVTTLLVAAGLAYGGRLHGARPLALPPPLPPPPPGRRGTQDPRPGGPTRAGRCVPVSGPSGSRPASASCSACSAPSPASTRCSRTAEQAPPVRRRPRATWRRVSRTAPEWRCPQR